MLLVMQPGSTSADRDRVCRQVRAMGFDARPLDDDSPTLLEVRGIGPPDSGALETLPGVERVLPVSRPLGRVDRRPDRPDTRIRVGGVEIGGGRLTLIAGPCAVEGADQLLPLARRLKRAGADLLRGGAYKPRTSPYDFQGLGEEGLRLLAAARQETGLPVVSEAVDERSLDLVARYADVVQIGARNMHNYTLLRRAGQSRLPIFLKRGFSASFEDLLLAAEYVLDQGNPHVMLCERGIRTFSDHSRFTLDLSIVPRLERHTHLPVFVDPSHASGIRESVAPLARAAVAVGADGVMIEVHPDPRRALCDGPQSLLPGEFETLAAELRTLQPLVSRPREAVS